MSRHICQVWSTNYQQVCLANSAQVHRFATMLSHFYGALNWVHTHSQLSAHTLSTECTHTLNWVHTHFQLNAHTLSTAIICHNYYQLMSRRLSQFHAYTPVYTCSENRLPAGPLLWRINKQRLNWITKLSNECTTIVGLKAHFCRRWSILCSDAVTGPT